MQVTGLFPIPIGRGSLFRDLTQTELNFFKKINDEEKYNNYANSRSANGYILHEPEMSNLHDDILYNVNQYILSSNPPLSDDLSVYITQSWINYTKSNQSHHPHVHPNSYISGVFYIDVLPDVDTITFFAPWVNTRLEYPSREIGIYNASDWNVPVKNKDIVLFPSNLTHSVPVNNADHVRISLSFNTFIAGTIGDRIKLSEVTL